MNILLKKSCVFLKPKQVQCIIQCCYNDVLAVLPTSYGKTIIFGILPYYVNLLRNSELTAKIVVVVPLTSIVIDKLKHFGRYAIRIMTKCFHVMTAQTLIHT